VRAVPMEVYGLGVLNRELEVLLQPGLALTVTRIDRDQAFCAREFTRYAHSRQTDVCVTVVHCDVRAL
jgi:U3 small nucleolar ribonucleoprotein component